MKILLLIITLLLSFNTYAEIIKKNSLACITSDLWDQLVTASVSQDMLAIDYLSKNGCIVTNADFKATVLDRTWSGTVKVRAYVGETTAVLWTATENIK